MRHEHEQKSSCGIHTYERKYMGNGKYYQRGICKPINIGDEFFCFTAPNSILVVDKIISINNSKGNFKNPEDKIDSLYEVELIDNSFNDSLEYDPLITI